MAGSDGRTEADDAEGARFTAAELVAVAERGYGVTAPVMAGALASVPPDERHLGFTRAEARRAIEAYERGDA